MCCWNLAVNCQYNIRLKSQTSTRSSFGSSTSFSTCSYPSSTPDDNDCGSSSCRWRLGLRASSKTPTNHSCSRHQFSSGFCEPIILSVSDSRCLVWCICVEKQNIDYEFWPDMSKISYCTLGKFLLHTYQFLLHTLCRKTHYFRPCYTHPAVPPASPRTSR